MIIKVSVPAKIILSGEHAVLQTGRALAAAINLRSEGIFQFETLCSICRDPSCKISISLGLVSYCYSIYNDGNHENIILRESTCTHRSSESNDGIFSLQIAKILAICLHSFNIDWMGKSMKITLKIGIPHGSGLGSSAVFSSIIAGGFRCLSTCANGRFKTKKDGDYLKSIKKMNNSTEYDEVLRRDTIRTNPVQQKNAHDEYFHDSIDRFVMLAITAEDIDSINNVAFECEKIFHSSPSGIDNSTVINGGICFFERSVNDCSTNSSSIVENNNLLNRKSKLNVDKLNLSDSLDSTNVDHQNLKFLIVDTRIKKDTKKILKLLDEKYKNKLQMKKEILDNISKITDSMKLNLSNFDTFLSLIAKNQSYLKEYGVGCDGIDELINIGKKLGFSGKISGAGCGGCIFFPYYDNQNIEQLKKQLKSPWYDCAVDQVGIRIEVSI